MNWNFFLKPTLEKVLIMIIIFLLIIFVPTLPNVSTNAGCLPGDKNCPGTLTSYENFYSEFLTKFPYNSNCLNCPSWSNLLIFLIIYFIVSYLLSSLIVSILNKFRKKK